MTYPEFKKQIISEFRNRYVKIDDQAGFNIRGIDGNKISVANTVEVLLTFEIMFNTSKQLRHPQLNCFDFDCVANFLKHKVDYIFQLDKESQRITELAYCGIGLLILGENLQANRIATYLCDNECKTLGGWGRYVTDKNPDLYETYLVTKLLYRLNRKIVCPNWIINSPKEVSGTKFLYDNKDLNNQNSIEALTILVYMLEHYYNISVHTEFKQHINSYFKTHIKDIKNANESSFARHPSSDYTIFAFGIASHILKNDKNPFFIENNTNICKVITEDFMRKPIKNIPFALEYVRLVRSIRDRYDPFDDNEHSGIKYQVEEKIEMLEKSVIDLNNRFNSLSFEISLTILLILLFLSATYFLIKSTLVKLLPELDNYDIYVIIGALIVPSILSITGIIKKLVRVLSKIYNYFVRKEKNKKNEKN